MKTIFNGLLVVAVCAQVALVYAVLWCEARLKGWPTVWPQADDEGLPDTTAQCAALDALAMIELPMRAAMISAIVAQAQYASQIALCEMQRAASLENAAIERRLAEAYARLANNFDQPTPVENQKPQ